MTRALVIASLLAVGCGATNVEPSPYGTSLFITTRWSSADYTLYQLRFSGFTAAGTDAFPPSARPDAPGDALSSGATVRVLLADDVVGQALELVVYGRDQRGETVVVASVTTPSIIAKQETRVTVDLVKVEDEVDAGALDAGTVTGPDGGVTCSCNNTCCLSTTVCANAPNSPRVVPFLPNDAGVALVADCGPVGRACNAVCDPLRSTNCAASACSCGLLGPCPQGTRCDVRNNVFSCVCDAYSNCPGCCEGNVCRPTSASFCANAGQQCTACGTAGCLSGVCAASSGSSCESRQCRSGRSCVNLNYPVCRNTSLIDACTSCDVLRTSGCGTGNVGCVCGTSPTCALDQYCDRTNPAVTPTCRPLRP